MSEFNINEIVNALKAEKRGIRERKQVEDILGGKIPDLQWKKALKEFKEMVIGYTQTPKATAKGWYEGFTAKPKKKEKKGGYVKTSKYSKGGGVRTAKYKV
jgi:hypothetical protein